MALVHDRSSESLDTGLDLFSVPPTQTAIESGCFVEYHPLSVLAPGAPVEFNVSGATADYLDLSNTYLHVRAKVVNQDGSALAAAAQVAPVNNWLHSLFQQVDIFLNGNLITGSQNTYPYRAYLETLLNFGSDAQETHLTSQLFYRDTPDQFGSVDPAVNEGFARRQQKAALSNEVDMMGRLHADICHQSRYILNGVDVKIRLHPSKDTFNLMTLPADRFKTQLTHVSLFVRKARPNPAVAMTIEKTLERDTCKYPLKRVSLKTFAIPQGHFNCIQDNLFLEQTPTRMFLALVDTRAFNGRFQDNPFQFQTYDLNNLSLYLDGKQIPAKPLRPDYRSGQHVRAYHQLNLSLGCANKDVGNLISYDSFSKGYTVYGFDLTPSLLDGLQYELIKSGALRIEMQFANALQQPVHVLVYGEFDSLLEIDRSRQIVKDF